jgi:RNA polymerase primary sigma factor
MRDDSGETPLGQDALTAYLRRIRRIDLLTRSGEFRLATLQRLDPNSPEGQLARERLVESNLRIVVKLAHEYRGRGVSVDDLVAEGNLGLFEAAARFDPSRGVRFVTYAVWWVRKFMLGAIRRSAKQRFAPMSGAAAFASDMRSSSEHDFSSLRRAILSLEAGSASVAAPRRGQESATAETAPDPETQAVDHQMEGALRGILSKVPAQERRVLTAHYGLDGSPPRTLQQIGDELGMTRERVRQIELRARDRVLRLLRRGL